MCLLRLLHSTASGYNRRISCHTANNIVEVFRRILEEDIASNCIGGIHVSLPAFFIAAFVCFHCLINQNCKPIMCQLPQCFRHAQCSLASGLCARYVPCGRHASLNRLRPRHHKGERSQWEVLGCSPGCPCGDALAPSGAVSLLSAHRVVAILSRLCCYTGFARFQAN